MWTIYILTYHSSYGTVKEFVPSFDSTVDLWIISRGRDMWYMHHFAHSLHSSVNKTRSAICSDEFGAAMVSNQDLVNGRCDRFGFRVADWYS